MIEEPKTFWAHLGCYYSLFLFRETKMKRRWADQLMGEIAQPPGCRKVNPAFHLKEWMLAEAAECMMQFCQMLLAIWHVAVET